MLVSKINNKSQYLIYAKLGKRTNVQCMVKQLYINFAYREGYGIFMLILTLLASSPFHKLFF